MKRFTALTMALVLTLGFMPRLSAATETAESPQVVGTAEKFNELMKGIAEEQFKWSTDYDVMETPEIEYGDASAAAEEPAQATAATEESMAYGAGYSETNTQVAGVDEADIIKTDGEYVYHLSDGDLRITKVNGGGMLTEVGSIKTFQDTLQFYVQDMYVDGDMLCLLGMKERYLDDVEVGGLRFNYEWILSYITVQVWDISNRAKPEMSREFMIDGSLVDSRKIGSTLYLIVNHYLDFYGADLPSAAVPEYYDSAKGGAYQTLSFDKMRYFPGDLDNSLLIVAGLDLDSKDEAEVESVLGSGGTAYMSANALYVARGDYNYGIYSSPRGITGESSSKTTFFKFGLEDGSLKYQAKAVADGHVLNQYSMDEYKDHFRAVTTGDKNGETVNMLTVFGADMKQTGHINNLAPGEQIYSARFMGDDAFMVTYRTVDPLFAMDLSDPRNPKVLGELKIPGYSSYLHPYDENHLIGFGRDTEEISAVDSKGNVLYTWAEDRALKLSMFDVTDMTKPAEVSNVTIGNGSTHSELLYNPKVFLFDKERGIIAIPVYHYDRGVGEKEFAGLNGIRVYNVTEDSLKYKGTISTANGPAELYDTLERVIFIGDIFYSVSREGIQSNSINTLKLIDSLRYQ